MSSLQRTRLSKVQKGLGRIVAGAVVGPWWLNSLRVIALLLGFFSASTLTLFLGTVVQTRTITALIALALCELLIFLRQSLCKSAVPLHWRLLDNLRIGFVYAVVLEAFKVGS